MVLRPFRARGGRSLRYFLEDWDQPLIGEGRLQWPAKTTDESCFDDLRPDTRVDLKCLLVTESMDASGMDEFVAFLARELPSSGIETAILLCSDSPGWREGALFDALRGEGVRVASVGESEGEGWIRAFQPDVLYAHGATEWPLNVAAAEGIPAIEALHGMHNLFNTAANDRERRRAFLHGTVAVSDLVRTQYLHLHPDVGERDVITIANGINGQRLPSVSSADSRAALGLRDEYLFVSLSRYSVQKNVYALIDGFLEAARERPEIHLLVCGRMDDEDYTGQILALRDRSPYSNRVHLRAGTERIDVILAAANAFVLDSFFEGWSLASMEALGAGVPVVLSDVGGAREQLADGPARGVLISNPLGDALEVDWKTMSAARFARQSNRAELVAALLSMADGSLRLADRDEIAAYARARYGDEQCLQAHAAVIRRAAQGVPVAEDEH